MGILVNIVTADEDDVEAIGQSQHPIEEWGGIEARSIDTAKIATIHCVLTGDTLEDALSAYEPVYAVDHEGPLVLRIPDEVVERLAELEEDAAESVGDELAATEEFEMEGWPVGEVQALVGELAELARIAEARGQGVFVWMHPLMT